MLARISLCSELVLCHILESSGQHTLKSLVFCTLSHIIRIVTIIYDVLQHYYDNRCSPESWSSLLTSLLDENNRRACAPSTLDFQL